MQTTTTTTPGPWAALVPANVVVDNPDHMTAVHAFAVRTGRVAQLREQLERLGQVANRGRAILGWDFAPFSFSFAIEVERDGVWKHWISGGLIFHGSHDGGGNGGAPTYAVSMGPVDGWSIHT